jgi:hypothetical protein
LVQPSSSHCRLPMALLQAHGGCRPNPAPLRRAIHSRHPPPLSTQRSASAHRTPYTRRWQCESRSDVAACPGQRGPERLGGGRTAGVQSGRMDRDSSAPSTGRFAPAACASLPPLQTRWSARTHATPHPLHGVRKPGGGTPWSVPGATRVQRRPEGVLWTGNRASDTCNRDDAPVGRA